MIVPATPDGPRLHFDVHGDSGPEVLLVMGLGMRGSVWKPQTDDLARDHRLVTYDHRGLGASEARIPFPFSMRAMADDALRVADAARLGRPHLVGVSMGGMIAQELALAHLDRFASLTLIATHPGRAPSTIPPLRTLGHLRQAFTGRPAARRRAFFALLYPDDFVGRADPADLAARARAQIGSPAPMRTLASQLSAIARHDTTSRLAALRMPVLLVRPDRDVLVRPVGLDRLAARLPHAELLRFPDAGHGVTFQEASRLNAALRAFFARSAAPTP